MKSNITLIILIFSIFTACNQPTDNNNNDIEPQEIMVPDSLENEIIAINVEGMTCEGCENAINTNIKELQGIKFVSSSHKDKIVKVAFDTLLVNLDDIKITIKETGYTVIE